MKDREGYDDMLSKLLRSMPPEKRLRLIGLSPADRLAGFSPEDRLAGLPPEQILPALPGEILRGLTDEYIRSLPRRVQSAIRKRLAQSQPRPRSRR